MVKIKISHSYRNKDFGGGTSLVVTDGSYEILAAKSSGKSEILAEVTQVGKRGKVTTWTGNVKL